MKVLVLGLGVSGRSAAQYLLQRNASVVGIDKNSNLPVADLCRQGMVFLSEESGIDVSSFDLVVVSPGISPTHPIYSKALEQGIEVIGEVELACRDMAYHCRHQNLNFDADSDIKKCLAVTGTNGKTTVTLLTEHVLQQAGIKAKALGNVGTPLTAAMDDADLYVIELSSFQLETLTSRFIDAGVILNITPDHLDRYPSMEAYAAAKISMEKNIKERGVLFVEDKCFQEFGHLFANDHPCYGYSQDDYLYTDKQEVYLKGKKMFSLPEACKHLHDMENIMASFALCNSMSISPEQFLSGLASFKKPSHRIEFVRTIDGVHYYDDSKGTNIDAVMRAVEGLEGQIVLIAGGVDKGFPYTPWINAFAGKVKAICAIGEAKEKIRADLEQHIPVETFSCMEEAVSYAASVAKKGENVLLSPGCSSFDMFKDYAHRGKEFQRLINALTASS
jgi:UDP-N-acetylmuramoylalanine--D-glutamate ligase